MSQLSPLEALLSIVRATYSCKAVYWFGGDHDDAPGWRAYPVDSLGACCASAPPRLTREEAEADLQWVGFEMDSRGFVFPYYNPPEGWPGRKYGIDPEECGPNSRYGMDIPEEAAESWAKTMRYIKAA